jgi:acetate---CoA ligase (ADP-forming) subunit beta
MVTNVFQKAIEQNRIVLTELESKQLIKELGIKTTEIKLAVSEEEAVKISNEIGFPVVMKISSQDITHKSDAGGVKVGLKTSAEVAQAFRDIMSSCTSKFPSAKIEGIVIQNMAKPGVEVIVGMTKDPQFGPVIMFGLGGIWVELLKDTTFRITPLTKTDARDMITEIKSFALLKGFRGTEPVDLLALEDILIKVSSFVDNHPQIKEMDLNPIFAYKDGAIVVDARIILEPNIPA